MTDSKYDLVDPELETRHYLLARAEEEIRQFLLELDSDLDGSEVDSIEIDTRNFANMHVTIVTRPVR